MNFIREYNIAVSTDWMFRGNKCNNSNIVTLCVHTFPSLLDTCLSIALHTCSAHCSHLCLYLNSNETYSLLWIDKHLPVLL